MSVNANFDVLRGFLFSMSILSTATQNGQIWGLQRFTMWFVCLRFAGLAIYQPKSNKRLLTVFCCVVVYFTYRTIKQGLKVKICVCRA